MHVDARTRTHKHAHQGKETQKQEQIIIGREELEFRFPPSAAAAGARRGSNLERRRAVIGLCVPGSGPHLPGSGSPGMQAGRRSSPSWSRSQWNVAARSRIPGSSQRRASTWDRLQREGWGEGQGDGWEGPEEEQADMLL